MVDFVEYRGTTKRFDIAVFEHNALVVVLVDVVDEACPEIIDNNDL